MIRWMYNAFLNRKLKLTYDEKIPRYGFGNGIIVPYYNFFSPDSPAGNIFKYGIFK